MPDPDLFRPQQTASSDDAPRGDDESADADRLREERDFWKSLFENLVQDFPEPVLVVDDDGTITHWNDPHVELSGITHEEAIGNKAIDVIGTEGVTETLAEEIARTGESVSEDKIRSNTGDDNEWHIRAAGAPLRDTDGEPIGAFEYINIVTDLEKRRREIKNVQEEITDIVHGAVDDLLETTEQNAETNDQLRRTSRAQVQNLETIRDEMESLSATVEEVAASADEVSDQSVTAAELAGESKAKTRAIGDAIDEIREAATALADHSRDLQARMEEIDTLVDVIDGIADETNLLALNANIQAAQVGSGAEGFTVVADEVKDLADKSKEEVATIETIVDEVRANTDETVERVDTTLEQVDDAIDHAEAVDEMQSEITQAIDEASAGIEQIAQATDEQAATSEEVATMLGDAVEEIEQIADEVDTLAEVNGAQAESVRAVREDVNELESSLESA
ncbi:methyl-accepting chemotaxis protein [Natrarchaeobaculum aegyptiacum]|uniref:Chemotaxis protein n=1 Tax=Natrarchaeobaculum aegyptiacum TaxID=745377 RepID=A0A2Z2HV67_9EURY|nr:methyl-accepting chemotaxis protein [Natrarchaeobaculum aegyptiacum]ARS91090.1 chemotaxis protein [Natrarchaeobaculum aegyptiacum]